MIRIGIICPSEIAFRRFLPALQKTADKFTFAGVAFASPKEWFGDLSEVTPKQIEEQQKIEYDKAFTFGGKVFESYETILESDEIDAIYIPLPPALHYKWAKLALENGKHVFVEKPSTMSLVDTDDLIRIASERGLALHENYMFIYHDQLKVIDDVLSSGEIGNVRLYRVTFGFPMRQANDFRYNKALGGGALLDAGGYCLKYANILLGGNAKVVAAQANFIDGFEVDFYGSATLSNENGTVAQLAFGMDNDYRCDIEIWGSKGTISSNRIFTAPVSFTPSYLIKKNQEVKTKELPVDDAFFKSIIRFEACVNSEVIRKENCKALHRQAVLVEQFRKLSNLF